MAACEIDWFLYRNPFVNVGAVLASRIHRRGATGRARVHVDHPPVDVLFRLVLHNRLELDGHGLLGSWCGLGTGTQGGEDAAGLGDLRLAIDPQVVQQLGHDLRVEWVAKIEEEDIEMLKNCRGTM